MMRDADHEKYKPDGDEDALDTEMALLAMTAGDDIGGPLQDLDLSSLTADEKRVLLQYLRHRLHLVPDFEDMSDAPQSAKEPDAPYAA